MYCTASDLYAHGLPRGATPNPGRVLESAVSNVCTLDVHGFSTGTAVQFRAAGAGSLPAGLVEGTTYYAEEVTESRFRVRATPTGSAVSFTDADDPVMVLTPLPIAEAIAWAQEVCNDLLSAHVVVPVPDPVPAILRMTAAELAAGYVMAGTGGAAKSLGEIVDGARKRLERWDTGVPITDAAAPPPANLATLAAVPYLDTRGWRRFGGL